MNNYIFQEQVNEWGNKIFPRATLRSIYKHLEEEVLDELQEAIAMNDADEIMAELADIQILSLQIAGKLGRNLVDAVVDKFENNKYRQWGEPDENGVVRHIK